MQKKLCSRSCEPDESQNKSSINKKRLEVKSNFHNLYKDQISLKAIDMEESIKLFSMAGITYNPYKQFKNFTFQIQSIVKTGEILSVKTQIGFFEVKVNIFVDFEKQNPFLNIAQNQTGCYGSIYFFAFYQQELAFKIISNQKISSIRLFFSKIIREIVMMKIASALQCTVRMEKYMGFDAIIYKQGCLFAMERGKKISRISSENIQDLKTALEKLHRFQFIHFDIKPENIVFSPHFHKVVFIDFGFSEFVHQFAGFKTFTTFRGTPKFCGEEMVSIISNHNKPTYVDVYYNDLFCLKESIVALGQKMKTFSDETALQSESSIQEESSQYDPQSLHMQLELYCFQYHYIQEHHQQIQKILQYKNSRIVKFKGKQILSFMLRVIAHIFNQKVFNQLKSFHYIEEYQQIQRNLQMKSERISHLYLQQFNISKYADQQEKMNPYFRFITNISQPNFEFQSSFSFKAMNSQDDLLDFQGEKLCQRDFEILTQFMRFDVKKLTFSEKIRIAAKFEKFVKLDQFPNISNPYSQIKFFFKYILQQVILKRPMSEWGKRAFFDVIYQLILLRTPIQEQIQTYLAIMSSQQKSIIQKCIMILSFEKILSLIQSVNLREDNKHYYVQLFKIIKKINQKQIQQIISNCVGSNEEEKAVITILQLMTKREKKNGQIAKQFRSCFIKISHKRLKTLLQLFSMKMNFKLLAQNCCHKRLVSMMRDVLRQSNHYQLHYSMVIIKYYSIHLQAYNEFVEFNKIMKHIFHCSQIYQLLNFQKYAMMMGPVLINKDKCLGYLKDIENCYEQNAQLHQSVNSQIFIILSKTDTSTFSSHDLMFLKKLFIKVQNNIFKIQKRKAYIRQSYRYIFQDIRLLKVFRSLGITLTHLNQQEIKLSINHYAQRLKLKEQMQQKEIAQVISHLFQKILYFTQYFYDEKNQKNKKQFINPLIILAEIAVSLEIYQLWFYTIHKIILIANNTKSVQIFSSQIDKVYKYILKNEELIPGFYLQVKYNDLFTHLAYFSRFDLESKLYDLMLRIINWIQKNPFDAYIQNAVSSIDKFGKYYPQRIMFQKMCQFFPINEIRKNPYLILYYINTAYLQRSQLKLVILKKIALHLERLSCSSKLVILRKYYLIVLTLPAFSKKKTDFICLRKGKRYIPKNKYAHLIKELKKQYRNDKSLPDRLLTKHRLSLMKTI